MYDAIDVVGIAERAAAAGATMRRDRARYAEFFAAAEAYAKGHGLVLAGDEATRRLVGDPPEPGGYSPLEYYSSSPLRDARGLADALAAVDSPAPSGRPTVVVMNTTRARALFTVAVDERPVAVVRAFGVYRGARAADIVAPETRGGAPVMGPDVQLLKVYRRLSDPAEAGAWAGLLADERRLRRLFFGGLDVRLDQAVGGAAARARPAAEMRRRLWAEFVPGAGRALVGAAATARAPREARRIQLVSARGLERERADVVALAKGLGVVVDARVNDPGVPGEKELRRITFHVEARGRREPVLDIFDAGERELIPFVRREVGGVPVRVAAPPVLARFRLVDFWTVQLLFRMGAVSATFARAALGDAARDLRAVGGLIDRSGALGLFPGDFLGVRVDAAVADKRAAKAARAAAKAAKKRGDKNAPRAFYPPYFPCGPRPDPQGAAGGGENVDEGWALEGLDYE